MTVASLSYLFFSLVLLDQGLPHVTRYDRDNDSTKGIFKFYCWTALFKIPTLKPRRGSHLFRGFETWKG